MGIAVKVILELFLNEKTHPADVLSCVRFFALFLRSLALIKTKIQVFKTRKDEKIAA